MGATLGLAANRIGLAAESWEATSSLKGGRHHAVLHSYRRLVLDLCAGTGGAGDKGAARFSQEDQLGEQCAPQHRQEDPSPISKQDSPNLHKEHTCLPWNWISILPIIS